ELDQAGVDLTQARNQYQIAQKHLDALMATGKQQALKSAAGQLQSAKGKYMGAEAQMSTPRSAAPSMAWLQIVRFIPEKWPPQAHPSLLSWTFPRLSSRPIFRSPKLRCSR